MVDCYIPTFQFWDDFAPIYLIDKACALGYAKTEILADVCY